MSARIFQERKMSAGFFVSASESAAYVFKNERTKGLFISERERLIGVHKRIRNSRAHLF